MMTPPDTRPKALSAAGFATPPALFATPPAAFRRSWGCWVFGDRGGWPDGLAAAWGDLLAGIAVALWALPPVPAAKVARRPGVVAEDLRVLPGRSGLAALTMGGMAAAAACALPTRQPGSAGCITCRTRGSGAAADPLLGLPAEARQVNDAASQLVGFIVVAAASALGGTGSPTDFSGNAAGGTGDLGAEPGAVPAACRPRR
jgi:tellurite resistance protein